MKLLLDQGLPRSAVRYLNEAGIDAVHTADVDHATAADSVILEFARATSRIIATFDADFHSLLALSGALSPSVIRIRIEGLQGSEISALLLDVITRLRDELASGSVVTVQETRVRVRRLPLISI